MRVETGTRTRMGMGTKIGMGAKTRAGGAGTRIDMKVEGRESLGTYEVVNRGGSEDARGGTTPTSN